MNAKNNTSLTVILTHQCAESVQKMLDWWKDYAALDSILLAYGGPQEEFERLAHPQKIYIEDARLRSQDHQREMQSYTDVYQKASSWLAAHEEFRHVFFAEYDHLPVASDFMERMRSRLAMENADVLAFHLQRIDGTNHPHYLHAAHDPKFHAYWRAMSCREEKKVVLSMFGTGSFWTREAFLAVSECAEPFPMYLEIYLPTLAHHLGFRLRDFGEQNQFVRNLGEFFGEMETARNKGAWTIHPVKNLW